jgi:adenylosuccinate synthase
MDVTLNYSFQENALFYQHMELLDAASEASKGKTKIGSTLKVDQLMDKTGRNGIHYSVILN